MWGGGGEAGRIPFPEADIVVVGAGLSGAVIAERYARLLGKRVLVLARAHQPAACQLIRLSDVQSRCKRTHPRLMSPLAQWTEGSPDRLDCQLLQQRKCPYNPCPVNVPHPDCLDRVSVHSAHSTQACTTNCHKRSMQPLVRLRFTDIA